jgi:hypothetical protein
MFSSIHNRFSVATETKFGAIPPTFLSKAEEVKEPELSIANDVLTEMEETVENVTEDMVVENITMSLCQAPEPIESKEIEDEVFEKYTPISNNPLFVEPADFVLDDIYANYDDDNFEEQKPAKKKRGALKTFLNEFKPTYRRKLKKSKSGL